MAVDVNGISWTYHDLAIRALDAVPDGNGVLKRQERVNRRFRPLMVREQTCSSGNCCWDILRG